MKKCKCGFKYETIKDLEIIKLIKEDKIKYYCPWCKSYKYTKKYNFKKNEHNINEEI